MRVNVYAEELPDDRRVERARTIAGTGKVFFGARIFLKSADALHDYEDGSDDDRSAITFWGPRDKVAALLREAADIIDESNPIEKAG